jgi:alkylation response protein AidB-like acyl-CoA dehydrogenase
MTSDLQVGVGEALSTDAHGPRPARDLPGGNGILLDFRVMRHIADFEAVHIFEGAETSQTLVVGRGITRISAFTRQHDDHT